MRGRALSVVLCSLALLSACSPVFFSDEPDATGNWRRLYVNDAAPNDSLPPHLARDGVKFVLQPGKPYQLSVEDAGSDDVLELFSVAGSSAKSLRTLTGVPIEGRMAYNITSNDGSAGMFMARLRTGGSPASVGHVSLASLQAGAADTLKVKLLFVQTLTGLSTDEIKASFAADFFSQMNSILRPYGLAVAGIHEVVQPRAEPLDFPFSNFYVSLPGTRAADYAHIYLVEKITAVDPSTGLPGKVLGFATREVVDISSHRESRVVLSNQASTIRQKAITATHELAHFFGMRHTVSSHHDKLQDMDLSNDQDGFTDTRFCVVDTTRTLSKRGAGGVFPEADDGLQGIVPSEGAYHPAGPYCLRMVLNPCSLSLGCDLTNLMHPNECGDNQVTLTPQQSAVLRRNIALYHR